MTKLSYQELLKDPKWNAVRLRILARDYYTCRKCHKTNCVLQVHHKVYLRDGKPWDVPDRFLITLCSRCHESEHKNKLISDFVLNKIPSPRRKGQKVKRSNKHIKKEWIAGKGLVPVVRHFF